MVGMLVIAFGVFKNSIYEIKTELMRNFGEIRIRMNFPRKPFEFQGIKINAD